MIDLKQLEAEREKATIDKADLFDFYNDNWDAVIAELRQFQVQQNYRERVAEDHLRSNYKGGWWEELRGGVE